MSQGPLAWESDFEVALRFFRRRWWDEVQDLLDRSRGATLAFDDLDLDVDLTELSGAMGMEKLARLARRGLDAPTPEEVMDPAIRALEHDDLPRARAFVRLIAANLAFALRTDELLASLIASTLEPRLDEAALGALVARTRSARVARVLLASRPAAAAAVEPSARDGDWQCVHVRAETDAVGEALARVHAKRGHSAARWTERHAKQPLIRYAVTRPRLGWVTLLAPGGIERAFAQELAGAAPSLSRVVWTERKGDVAHFARFEGSRLVDDDQRLAERLSSSVELDDVTGALRALGIVAHDVKAPGHVVPLSYEGIASGDASVKLTRATGFAFLPKAETERLDRAAGKRLFDQREDAKRKGKERRKTKEKPDAD
jgi:hypothetical protein